MNVTNVADRLRRFEGSTDYMYRCTGGEVTVGVGHAIFSSALAQTIAWYGSPSNVGIVGDYERVAGAPKGLPAARYAALSRVRLDAQAVEDLLERDIENYTASVQSAIPEFGSYPESVQEALFDMAFNLGVAGLLKFPKLLAACRAGDWQTAALESRRRGIQEERNAEIAALFAGAQNAAPEPVASD